MKVFYYIVYRKPRGRSKQYAGDGVVEANNKTEARKLANARYTKINKSLTEVSNRYEDQVSCDK